MVQKVNLNELVRRLSLFPILDDFQKKEGKTLTFGSFNQAFFDRYEKFLVSKEHPFLTAYNQFIRHDVCHLCVKK